MNQCEMTAPYVFEAEERLELVRSANVFAVGVARDGTGVLVHFVGSRWHNTMYLFRGATPGDARELRTAASCSGAVRTLEARLGSGELLDVALTEALDETWGMCSTCAALVAAEQCPECGAPSLSDFAVDRCPACKTYVVSISGGPPLGHTCSGWASAS
jgi:hypothetical protein